VMVMNLEEFKEKGRQSSRSMNGVRCRRGKTPPKCPKESIIGSIKAIYINKTWT
jgi:hypothetical protein